MGRGFLIPRDGATGLTPNVTYGYEVDAFGALFVAHANGSVTA
ncbi:MAG: hypothetical protein ACR2JW_19000 [Thermomicrobiales bacterium]